MPDEKPKELSPEEEELERLEERFRMKCKWDSLRNKEAAAEAFYGPEPESPEEPENQPT
jgi:hypothetical protein